MALLWFWCCLAAGTDAIYADAALADDDAVATGANAAGADANAHLGNAGDSRRQGKATVELVEKAVEQAVDQQFEFAQSSYSLNVNDISVNYQLSFYLIEKRRKLNIRKFDNN